MGFRKDTSPEAELIAEQGPALARLGRPSHPAYGYIHFSIRRPLPWMTRPLPPAGGRAPGAWRGTAEGRAA